MTDYDREINVHRITVQLNKVIKVEHACIFIFINFKLEIIMAIYGDGKHNSNEKASFKPKKKNKLSLDTKKDLLIDLIIDNLQNNEYESRDYIYSLVKEALKRRTLSELKQWVNGN